MTDIINDLDGTILRCSEYYEVAALDVAQAMSEKQSIDLDRMKELINFIDAWAVRIRLQDGFKKERFPKSLAAAVAVAQFMTNEDDFIYPAVMQWARWRGEEIFDFEKTPYTPFEGALDTLRAYATVGHRLFIYTKGDPEVQEGKLRFHGIDAIVHGVSVVPKKDVQALEEFCTAQGIDPKNAVYVGDSVRDDMMPAKSIGMTAVRIGPEHSDQWLHGQVEDLYSDHKITSYKDLPTVVPL